MVDIEVSQETTNRLHAILSGLGKADEKVLKPAMQRGLVGHFPQCPYCNLSYRDGFFSRQLAYPDPACCRLYYKKYNRSNSILPVILSTFFRKNKSQNRSQMR